MVRSRRSGVCPGANAAGPWPAPWLAVSLVALSLAGSLQAADPAATVAVVGFRSCGAVSGGDSWLGVAVAEGLAARLTGLRTGIAQVERVDVAEVLRRHGLSPVNLDDRDETARRGAVGAMRALATQDTPGARVRFGDLQADLGPLPALQLPTGRLRAATHLILGDVLTDKPWGQGGALVVTARVVSVATGVVLDDSGAVVRGEASVDGLQQTECKLAARLCLALGGDISQLDLKAHPEQPEVCRRFGEARRALLEGRCDEALKQAEAAWQASSAQLLPSLMRTTAEAYQAEIATARSRADGAATAQLRDDWRRKAAELLAAYDRATSTAARTAGAAYGAAAFERAQCLWTQDRYAEAIPEYREAIAHGQEGPVAQLALGFALLRSGQADAARGPLDLFVGLRPREYVGYAVRGMARAQSGDLAGAVADYTVALGLRPSAAEAFSARAAAYCQLRQYDRALEDYDRARTLAPEDGELCLNRGSLLLQQGRSAEALTDFEAAVRLRPDDSLAYCRRGQAHGRQRALDLARRDFDTALILEPDCVPALANRGLTCYRQGDLAAARRDLDRVLGLAPRHVVALVDRAAVRLAQGDATGAITDYDRALELQPDNGAAWAGRGSAYCSRGDYLRALADYRQALAREPENAGYGASLAWAHYRAGQLTEAAGAAHAAVALDPRNPYAAANYGLILLAQGRAEEAVAQYRTVCALPGASLQEANCLGDLREFCAKQPPAEGQFCLGLVAEALGQLEEAARAYRDYLDSQPPGKYTTEARERLAHLPGW